MERISTFHSFISESYQDPAEFMITPEVIDNLKKDCDFLRSSEINGVVGEIFSLSDESAWPHDLKLGPSQYRPNGFNLVLDASEIHSLIEALDEGMYYIIPNWFEKKNIGFVFIQDTGLNPGEFKINDGIDSQKNIGELFNNPNQPWGNRYKHREKYLLNVHLGFDSYQDLLQSFESSIKAISGLFSRVMVLEDKGVKKIPDLLSKEIKPKIKQVYQEVVKDFFKSGEIDPELTSLKDVIAEIFKEKKEIINLIKDTDLSKDLMAKVIDSLMNDDEKEIVKFIKAKMKVSKAMKYL